MGTTKYTAKMLDTENKVIKTNKLQRCVSQKSPFRRSTDVISIRPPEETNPFQEALTTLLSTQNFGTHTMTKQGWSELVSPNQKSVNNRSSVPHNIISHMPNQTSGNLIVGVSNNKVLNRKKGVCTFSDEARGTALHFNQDFRDNYKTNPHIFKHMNTFATAVYDEAHRFGIDRPFRV